MVDQDIITSLKNAVERGESLQDAIKIAIASGYSQRDVQEASKFIGGVTISQEIKPDEHLVMPDKKSFFSKLSFSKKNILPVTQPVTNMQQVQQIKNEISPQSVYQKPMQQMQVPVQKNPLIEEKQSYFKEIILVAVLLILIAILILTILFKDQILGFFS